MFRILQNLIESLKSLRKPTRPCSISLENLAITRFHNKNQKDRVGFLQDFRAPIGFWTNLNILKDFPTPIKII